MYDTYVTLVGTAMTAPELRTTANTGAKVASFRIATHPRHFDQKTNGWVESPGVRIRVNCWRRLADHVVASVRVGDPIIVNGRLTTHDWKTAEGEPRTNFEVEAVNVGHDYGRGTASFTKAKYESAGAVIDDAESESRVRGELTYSMAESTATDEDGALGMATPEDEAISILRAAGFDDDPDAEDDLDEEEPTSATAGSGGPAGRSRRRGRQPVPA
jgi:single-strand DNA-binding protein